MRGFVNVDTLVNRIILSFRQGFCDFLVEQLCTTRSVDPVDDTPNVLSEAVQHEKFSDDFLNPCQKLLEQAVTLSSPTVSTIAASLKIPQWMKEDFLTEIRDTVCDINRGLAPTLLEKISQGKTVRYSNLQPTRKTMEAAVDQTRKPNALHLHTDTSELSHVLLGGVDHVCVDYNLIRQSSLALEGGLSSTSLVNLPQGGIPHDPEIKSVHTLEDTMSEHYARSRHSSISHISVQKVGAEDPWHFGETFNSGGTETKVLIVKKNVFFDCRLALMFCV